MVATALLVYLIGVLSKVPHKDREVIIIIIAAIGGTILFLAAAGLFFAYVCQESKPQRQYIGYSELPKTKHMSIVDEFKQWKAQQEKKPSKSNSTINEYTGLIISIVIGGFILAAIIVILRKRNLESLNLKTIIISSIVMGGLILAAIIVILTLFERAQESKLQRTLSPPRKSLDEIFKAVGLITKEAITTTKPATNPFDEDVNPSDINKSIYPPPKRD